MPQVSSAEDLLARWEARSRAVAIDGRTGYDTTTGWLVTVVGARGTDWGRLIICLPGEAHHRAMSCWPSGADQRLR